MLPEPAADSPASEDLSSESVESDVYVSRLNKLAASVLMKVLYAGRMARYDLLKAVNALAKLLTKWDDRCDQKLYRLMCYIQTTLKYRQVGYVGDDYDEIDIHLFTDADFAGCGKSQRSTTGVHLQFAGPTTCFPLNSVSKNQSCVSVSTPEAEMVAGKHGVLYELLPVLDLCDRVLRKGYKAQFHEDNTAMIRVLRTGRNPTMRHLERVHRVHVASLHEKFAEDNMCIFYEDSNSMAADIYTKGFTSPTKWLSALRLINIFTIKEQQKCCFNYMPREVIPTAV